MQYYTKGDVIKMLGINRTTLWRWEKRETGEGSDFPKPIRIGSIMRYKKVEVDYYLKMQEMQRPK